MLISALRLLSQAQTLVGLSHDEEPRLFHWCDKNQRLRSAINTSAQSCCCVDTSVTHGIKKIRRRHPQSISKTDWAANRTFVRLGRASADAEATLAWENSIGKGDLVCTLNGTDWVGTDVSRSAKEKEKHYPPQHQESLAAAFASCVVWYTGNLKYTEVLILT